VPPLLHLLFGNSLQLQNLLKALHLGLVYTTGPQRFKGRALVGGPGGKSCRKHCFLYPSTTVESCNISKLNADSKYRETVTRTQATSQELKRTFFFQV
jgi:hypothetical protein